MANDDLILTFDIGTTGNKCTIFSSEGKQLSAEVVPYQVIYPKKGWSEQSPDDFWQSCVQGTKKLMAKNGIDASNIAVIGLSGHMNGCIPMDKEGVPLFNNIIHSDTRSAKQSSHISEIFDAKQFYNITGNRIDPHYTLPKILWLKENHPDIYKDTAYFINSKDYISFKLTGNPGITDFSDASLTCMLDIKNKRWSQEILKALDIDPCKLPTLKKSTDIAGYVTKEAASLLGIRQGTPVVVGGGDGACATRGAGVTGKEQAYNYIGSSSWISTLTDSPVLDKQARTFNFYDLDGEKCNMIGAVQSATISYDWVVNNIAKHEVELSAKTGENIYQMIEDLAKQSPIGSKGVFFLPYLMGERSPIWDENTKGTFIGFTLYNNRNDLLRATYEGIAFALRTVLDALEDNDINVQGLTLLGGGSKSIFWNEIMCNIYNKNIRIHKYPGEATSLGAAFAAGVGVGIFKDLDQACSTVEYDRNYQPDQDKAQQYQKYLNVYKQMYPNLKNIFDQISSLA